MGMVDGLLDGVRALHWHAPSWHRPTRPSHPYDAAGVVATPCIINPPFRPPLTAAACRAAARRRRTRPWPARPRTQPIGSAAPTANEPAEASAAWRGRAAVTSESPSSSRACAVSAPLAMSWSATCRARARDVLPRGHRHRSRHQSRDAGHQDVGAPRAGGGHPYHQARGGDESVVGAQDGRAQPADMGGTIIGYLPGVVCEAQYAATPAGAALVPVHTVPGLSRPGADDPVRSPFETTP
jgi:hypothetical protein